MEINKKCTQKNINIKCIQEKLTQFSFYGKRVTLILKNNYYIPVQKKKKNYYIQHIIFF
jgi:hypothetical protein